MKVHSDQAAQSQDRNQSGFGAKVHVAVDGQEPLPWQLLMEDGGSMGPTGCKAEHAQVVRSHEANHFWNQIANSGVEAVIPCRKYRTEPISHDDIPYKERNVMEWAIGFIQHDRHIATCHDKMADSFPRFGQCIALDQGIKNARCVDKHGLDGPGRIGTLHGNSPEGRVCAIAFKRFSAE